MKALLAALVILCPLVSFAGNSCGDQCADKISQIPKDARSRLLASECAPKLRKKDQEIAALKRQIAELQAQVQTISASKVVMHPPVIREIISERVVNHEVTRRNSVSLLVPYAPTKLVVESDPGRYHAKTDYELDLGIMAQRDLTNSVRASAGITLHGIMMLGLGLNF